ncbi:hypothetical protein QPK14_16930 [Photorhabdus temperata subsp. temperata]
MMKNNFGVPLDVMMSNEKMTPEKAAEIVASGIPTSEAKVMQYVAAKAFLALAKNPISGSTAEGSSPQWKVGEGKFDGKSLSNVEGKANNVSKHGDTSAYNAANYAGLKISRQPFSTSRIIMFRHG